jgi:hypothetical protein
VDEDLRAQVKARRVSRRAQAWRARVMWTGLKIVTVIPACSVNISQPVRQPRFEPKTS